jgi:hypothetical protein
MSLIERWEIRHSPGRLGLLRVRALDGQVLPPGETLEVVEYRHLRGAVDAERERVTAAIDQIERDEYLNGLRCRDFKEALDAVRDALGGQ